MAVWVAVFVLHELVGNCYAGHRRVMVIIMRDRNIPPDFIVHRCRQISSIWSTISDVLWSERQRKSYQTQSIDIIRSNIYYFISYSAFKNIRQIFPYLPGADGNDQIYDMAALKYYRAGVGCASQRWRTAWNSLSWNKFRAVDQTPPLVKGHSIWQRFWTCWKTHNSSSCVR